jgi:hypothetical protein
VENDETAFTVTLKYGGEGSLRFISENRILPPAEAMPQRMGMDVLPTGLRCALTCLSFSGSLEACECPPVDVGRALGPTAQVETAFDKVFEALLFVGHQLAAQFRHEHPALRQLTS